MKDTKKLNWRFIMVTKVRQIEDHEKPKKAKTYRPELTQSNGYIAEQLASILDMSVGDIVNQVFANASLVEIISERKGCAIEIINVIGDMGEYQFKEVIKSVKEFEATVKKDDSVGTEKSDEERTTDDKGLGKSLSVSRQSPGVSGLSASVLNDDDDDADSFLDGEIDEEELSQEEENNS